MEYLYHGSVAQGLKRLEPRKRFTPAGKIEYAAIYATPNPLVAAAHAFPWSSEEGIDFAVDGSRVELTVPVHLKHKLEVPISIYKVSAEPFRLTSEEETGQTWDTRQEVDVIEEKTYPSVLKAFQVLGGSVRFT